MSFYARELTPLKGRIRNHPVVGFDVEGTGDEGGFILGVVYDGQPHVFHDRQRMLKHLLSKRYRGACIYAHNLVYDLGVIAQPFEGNWQLFDYKGRLIKATYRDEAGHKWLFLDTGNLLPNVSVGYLGEIVGFPKIRPPPYLHDLDADKVQSIRASPDLVVEITTYCVRDAEIVYRFALAFQNLCNQLGGNHKATLAATAMDVWRHSFQLEVYKRVKDWQNDYFRKAYYGGRVEVFTYGKVEKVRCYDYNSLYPTVALETKFPHPGYMVYHPAPADLSYIENYEGVSHVVIESPPAYIPLLPARVGDRLLFPTGQWHGHYTHLELRAALREGYHIKQVLSSLYSTETCRPFVNYVTTLYNLRKELKSQGSGMQKVVKFLLNGLTGKFGQRRNGGGRSYRVCLDYETFESHDNETLVIWQDTPFLVKDVTSEHDAVFVNCSWIAYITAAARIRLYEAMKSVDFDVYYCDTDSIYTSRTMPQSTELGGLKLEMEAPVFYFRRCKMKHGELTTPEFTSDCKGVPKDQQYAYCKDGVISYQRPTKLRSAFLTEQRLSVWNEITRRLGNVPLKRVPLAPFNWQFDNADSRPYDYEEACSAFKHTLFKPHEIYPPSFDSVLSF
ncbi:MAG: hypothetical protein HWN68_11850 [Desulfobacterales bacterium]|nr:hypothetical protein [Desulfobacterales bacterium]